MWPFNRLNLFWKIFLWFWTVMVVMVIVSIMSWLVLRDSINFHRADDNMKAVIDKLAYVLESDHSERRKNRIIHRLLRSFAPPMVRKPKKPVEAFKPFYLIDERGNAKTGELPPEAITALLSRSQKVAVAIHNNFIFIGPKDVNIDGRSYQLVVTQYIGRFKGRLIYHYLSSLSIWQLLAYLLVSGALCFLLAWSITKPIRALQSVSKRIANGESVSAVDVMKNRGDEFYRLAEDFDHMASKILNTVNTQKQLLSDVSHELRSPLSRMQIALGLLDKKMGNGESVHIQRLEKECSRMDEMIGQLLSIAALERGQLYEKEQNVELHKLLEDISNDAAFEANEKNVSIQCNIITPITLKGYYGLLYSAIENVVRNAIRYSPDNGNVTVRLEKSGSMANISVSDEGPGVDVQHREKIFEPFYRTDDARTREKGGAGLGLAITSRAIKIHNGFIKALENQPNGLKVDIQLPINAE